MTTHPGLNVALTRFADSTDRVRRDLTRADVLEIAGATRRDEAAVLISTSYVFLAAGLELLVKDCLEATAVEISSRGTKFSELRTSALCLFAGPALDSLQDVRGLKMWSQRSSIFSAAVDASALPSTALQLPLDGRTLRRAHFSSIWEVFGFPLPTLPKPQTSLALEDLADGRNDVAHGTVDPVAFGRLKNAADVARLLQLIEDLGVHLVTTADRYLVTRGFKR